jgi:hypothetical protein
MILVRIRLSYTHLTHTLRSHSFLKYLLIAGSEFPLWIGPIEFVFVIDHSGSMRGSAFEEARCALLLCLETLVRLTQSYGSYSVAWKFNVLSYGSTFEYMFPISQPCLSGALQDAVRKIYQLSPTMGGSDLYFPLKAYLSCANPNVLQNLILISDGHISMFPQVAHLLSA